MVLGYQGILQFTHLRKHAIQEIWTSLQTDTLPSAKDSFHDGHDVLAVVRDWHTVLRGSVRRTDLITHKVLDLVDGHMLVNITSGRMQTKLLNQELKTILIDAKKEHQEFLPPSIMASIMLPLVEFDRSAPSQAMEATDAWAEKYEKILKSGGNTAETKAKIAAIQALEPRKSKMTLVKPMKTGNRSALVYGSSNLNAIPKLDVHIEESAEAASQDSSELIGDDPSHDSRYKFDQGNQSDGLLGQSSSSNSQFSTHAQPPHQPHPTEDPFFPNAGQRQSSFFTQDQLRQNQPTTPRRNRHQVRKDLEKANKKWSSKFKLKKTPDKDLKGHFENRDIVRLHFRSI
jgi:hypothetical protein